MTVTWRLLIDEAPGDGAWNMALDRAIQLARESDDVPPTLRLYSWARPTVSLGRFQDLGGVDRAVCASEGIDVVRRFTGGRGVLHDDEVTYAIVAGLEDGVPRGTAASYRMLCTGLVEAYRLLGVGAAVTRRPRGDGSSAACYLHATSADLSLGAQKLSGSAQVWRGSTVLQHGSFTMSRDVAREASVFGLDHGAAQRLAEETVTIEQSLGLRPPREDIVAAIVGGIEQGLDVELAPGCLTDVEKEMARSLVGETDPYAQSASRRVGASG